MLERRVPVGTKDTAAVPSRPPSSVSATTEALLPCTRCFATPALKVTETHKVKCKGLLAQSCYTHTRMGHLVETIRNRRNAENKDAFESPFPDSHCSAGRLYSHTLISHISSPQHSRSFQLLKNARDNYVQTFRLGHYCCPGCLPRERILPKEVGRGGVWAPLLLPSSHPLKGHATTRH